MADRGLTLGIDLGTSAVKLVVVDADARVLAASSSTVPTRSGPPGMAEQDTAEWLRALRAASRALEAASPKLAADWRDRVAAIGLTGQLPTLVCGRGEQVLGPAITWQDARADDWASSNIAVEERRSLYALTGMPVDGRYLGPMFRFHWSTRAAEVEWVLSAKDYLAFALTGARVTDPSTASGYAVFELERGAFSEQLCARWHLDARLLPVIQPSEDPAGRLSAAGAGLLELPRGLPVATGAADSVAGAYALSGLTAGVACISMGSSTVILDAVPQIRLDPRARYLLTPHVRCGWYGREMDLLATGTGYDWLTRLLGLRTGELDAKAAESVPGARGLTFTPYLAGGEQGALWNPQLRGSLCGLTATHGAEDIARAFLEGVGFEIRRCLDVLAETARPDSIVLTGAAAARASSVQLLADIIGRPIVPKRLASAAALGAALSARSLLGESFGSPAAANDGADEVSPRAARLAYQGLYDTYLARHP